MSVLASSTTVLASSTTVLASGYGDDSAPPQPGVTFDTTALLWDTEGVLWDGSVIPTFDSDEITFDSWMFRWDQSQLRTSAVTAEFGLTLGASTAVHSPSLVEPAFIDSTAVVYVPTIVEGQLTFDSLVPTMDTDQFTWDQSPNTPILVHMAAGFVVDAGVTVEVEVSQLTPTFIASTAVVYVPWLVPTLDLSAHAIPAWTWETPHNLTLETLPWVDLSGFAVPMLEWEVLPPTVEIDPWVEILRSKMRVGVGRTRPVLFRYGGSPLSIPSWSSSDPTVATAMLGTITGVGKGTCTITAQVAPDVTDTVQVTVSRKGSAWTTDDWTTDEWLTDEWTTDEWTLTD
jgi:hypothetical protein